MDWGSLLVDTNGFLTNTALFLGRVAREELNGHAGRVLVPLVRYGGRDVHGFLLGGKGRRETNIRNKKIGQ